MALRIFFRFFYFKHRTQQLSSLAEEIEIQIQEKGLKLKVKLKHCWKKNIWKRDPDASCYTTPLRPVNGYYSHATGIYVIMILLMVFDDLS